MEQKASTTFIAHRLDMCFCGARQAAVIVQPVMMTDILLTSGRSTAQTGIH